MKKLLFPVVYVFTLALGSQVSASAGYEKFSATAPQQTDEEEGEVEEAKNGAYSYDTEASKTFQSATNNFNNKDSDKDDTDDEGTEKK